MEFRYVQKKTLKNAAALRMKHKQKAAKRSAVFPVSQPVTLHIYLRTSSGWSRPKGQYNV